MYTYNKQFKHLYLDPNSHLILYCTPNRIFEEVFIKNLNPSSTKPVFVFHFNFFAIDKTHSHGHSGKNFLLKPLTIFLIFLTYLYGSLFSFKIVFNAKQIKKHFPIKTNKISPPLPFHENATHFNY